MPSSFFGGRIRDGLRPALLPDRLPWLSGVSSTAMGWGALASGTNSSAFGEAATAAAYNGVAVGEGATSTVSGTTSNTNGWGVAIGGNANAGAHAQQSR